MTVDIYFLLRYAYVVKGPLDSASLERMADATAKRDVADGEVVAAQDAVATEVNTRCWCGCICVCVPINNKQSFWQ